tara:strand:+ start:2131 stop:2721 length:591 start_codon:yes stop_codon:yes gene_type:complete
MALNSSEIKEIKDHLLKQLGNFPEDRRKEIENKINSMNPEELGNFIQQNQLMHLGQQCIFCSIVSEKTPSFKIDEDNKNIAIFEINPLSKGHTLIIPKEHSTTILDSTENFAKRISDKLSRKFSPEKIKIEPLEVMKHKLLEIIPLYGNETKRTKVSEEILKDLQEKFKESEPEVLIKTKKDKEELVIPKLPPRIP